MHARCCRVALVGIVVIGWFLQGNAWCAQMDLNHQPLASETNGVEFYAQKAPKNQASTNASTQLVVPAVVFVAASALDLHSTRWAINRGAREANPLMGQSFGRQAAVKAAGTVAALWLARRLEKKGHPRVAKIALLAASGALVGIAARNYAQGGPPQAR